MSIVIEYPPALGGTQQEQLRQVYAYLVQMSDALNSGMNNLSAEQFIPEQRAGMVQAASGAPGTEQVKVNQTLRSLIIKSATEIHHAMDLVGMKLSSSYEASSDWGKFAEQLSNAITLSAEGVVQRFDYDSQITNLSDALLGVEESVQQMSTVIRIGQQDGKFTEDGLPVFGVGIYDITEGSENSVVLTAGGLRFYNGNQTLAWFDTDSMFIPVAKITRQILFGGLSAEVEPGGNVIWRRAVQ